MITVETEVASRASQDTPDVGPIFMSGSIWSFRDEKKKKKKIKKRLGTQLVYLAV